MLTLVSEWLMPWITPNEPIVHNGRMTHTPMSVKDRIRHGSMTDDKARECLGIWDIDAESVEHIIATGGWD